MYTVSEHSANTPTMHHVQVHPITNRAMLLKIPKLLVNSHAASVTILHHSFPNAHHFRLPLHSPCSLYLQITSPFPKHPGTRAQRHIKMPNNPPPRSHKAWVRKHQPSYWEVWFGKGKKKDKDNSNYEIRERGRENDGGGYDDRSVQSEQGLHSGRGGGRGLNDDFYNNNNKNSEQGNYGKYCCFS
jgi:hypothetical protein